MSRASFILFPGAANWRIGIVDAGGTPRFEEVAAESAAAIAERLRALGYAGGGVMLAIPSDWCLAARIPLDRISPRDRQAMVFRLEEKLPLAAEEFVADFIVADAGDVALGVAAKLDRLRPWVEAMESAGVAVASICPAALLAADVAGQSADDEILIIDEGDGRLNLIARSRCRPVAWAVAAASADDVQLQLRLMRLQLTHDRSVPVATTIFGMDPSAVGLGADVRHSEGCCAAMAAIPAAIILSGRAAPFVELRRDALAPADRLRSLRRPINALLASAAALLLALTIAFIVAGLRYDRAARSAEAQMADEFRKAFPGRPVPADVRLLVESEHRKLNPGGGGGAGGGSRPEEARRSAAKTMAKALVALPPDPKLALDRMTFEDRGFELEGRVETPAALNAVVDRLIRAGFEISPPQSHRGDDGFWSFTLAATSKPRQAVAAGTR